MGLFHRSNQPSLAEATAAATTASHKRIEAQKSRSGRKNKPSAVVESYHRSRQSSTTSSSSSISSGKFPIETPLRRKNSKPLSTPVSAASSPSPERPQLSSIPPPIQERPNVVRNKTATPDRPRISRAHTPISITHSATDKLPSIGTGATIEAGPNATVPPVPSREPALPPLAMPNDEKKRLPSISGLCMNPPTPDAESPTPTQTRFNGLPKTGLVSGPRPRTAKASDEWREYKEKRRSGWVGS